MEKIYTHYKHKKTNLLLSGMFFIVAAIIRFIFTESTTKAESISIQALGEISSENTITDTTREDEQIKETPSFNFFDDSSFQKHLGNKNNLNNSDYTPNDLQTIPSDFLANNSNRFVLRQEAGEQFAKLTRQFWHNFNGDKIYLSSAYRSKDFQAQLAKGCNPAKCAKPGSSEHQLGLAVDISSMTKNGKLISINKGNKYYQRLQNNASQFGFQNTYQKGIEVDGQMEEGRHRRYVGKDLATELQNKKQTFAEYLMYNSAF